MRPEEAVFAVGSPPTRSTGGARPAPFAGSNGSFWRKVQRFRAGESVPPRPGEDRIASIISGWACEVRLFPDGGRQIFTFRLPGDMVVCGPAASTTLVALTQLEMTPIVARRVLSGESPDAVEVNAALVSQALWLRDHILRLGALDAYQRTAHLLLEFHDRLAQVGLVRDGAFRVPLTQEMFGEALGLSAVHVNRMLTRLRGADLVIIRTGGVTLIDIPALRNICRSPSLGEGSLPLILAPT